MVGLSHPGLPTSKDVGEALSEAFGGLTYAVFTPRVALVDRRERTVPNSQSQPPASSDIPLMTGLGQALRWLREKQARKQYRVADTAGITKGMLSAYETGRQRPS